MSFLKDVFQTADEIKHKNPPWPIVQHGHETLDERRLLLLRGKHTFTRIGKSQQQQTHADHAIILSEI